MSENKLTITINPQDLLITLTDNLTICSNAVFMGLAMLNDLEKLPEHIPGEDNFRVHSPFADLPLDTGKKIFRDWIIKKGFEDLIKGVSGMLVDYCNLLHVNDRIKTVSTIEALRDLISGSNDIGSEKHLPELLKLVKSKISGDLEYEYCIVTINQVRNCLVHRNGIVSAKDTKTKEALTLKWAYFRVTCVNNEGQEQAVEPFMLLKGGFSVNATIEKKVKEFRLNQHIEITYQEFNELKDTCLLFANDLMSKFRLEKN